MKAQRPVGLALAWTPLTAVFLVDVAILVLVSNWPEVWRRDIAWWTGVGIAAAAALLVLVTYRGVPLGRLVLSWIRNFFVKPAPKLAAGHTTPAEHRHRFGHATVGVRQYRGALVAVVAVAAPAEPTTGRHSQVEAAAAELPVAAIAAGLRQFDVRLDGIDIVSVDAEAATASGEAPGERPPGAWLVLRMDPQRNVDAATVRDSVAAMLAAAAERIAEDLGRRRFDAWPLNADELADLDATVLAGLRPAETRVRLRFLKQVSGKECDGYVSSFWISPKDLAPETFDELWLAGVDATVLTIRLTPRDNQVAVSAWVRYHSAEPLAKENWRGLNRLTGRQLPAVLTGLPVPGRQRLLRLPGRVLAENDPLTLPLRQPDVVRLVEADQ